MKKLKGVAVGAGYFSQFHFDAWSRLPEVELSAVCDVNADSAQQASEKYSIANTYRDVGEMLDREKPDFIDIITRPDSHLALVGEAAKRGVAVVCQKALAPTFEEAKQIVEVAESASVPLMVHENFRFQPWYREIRRQIENGAIGDQLFSVAFECRMGDGWQPDAYLARQPYFREMPRLLIFETGVHFVDTYRYVGGEIAGVYATLNQRNPDIAGEDSGTVMFEFESGANGLWRGNRYNEPTSSDARFTFGEAIVDGSGGSLRLYGNGRLTLQPLGEPEHGVEYRCERRGFAGDCVYATQRHFVDCMLAGTPMETSGREYLKSLVVVDAIYESSQTKMPVRGLSGEAK
ncbi:Gfo/Idh/MocA family protein [Rhodopirellula sallentina]|uniref:Oxidoreductase domain-containing protein n=1 Tax=Rhodopirellula sallentina SM41 TaxID=1263870 RepID=M5TTQ1_9BACT|nr:Gfo/Idh/MocA family oxidoreductase [Rhodopirellula sallentina]EMI52429.1 oxidoreductase domain-containing protein [Rhodopirellula sallentina SM41]